MWPFSSSSSSSSAGPSSAPGASEPSAAAAAAAPSSFVPDASVSSSAASPSSHYSASGAAEYVPPSASALLLDPAFSPAALHPLAGLGKEDVEYLDIVDAQPATLEGARTALPSRGWSDDLCYGTGTTYLSGAYRVQLGSGEESGGWT
jgi:import inner membrane translocase subunit TIM23